MSFDRHVEIKKVKALHLLEEIKTMTFRMYSTKNIKKAKMLAKNLNSLAYQYSKLTKGI